MTASRAVWTSRLGIIVVLAAAATLSACGRRGDLEPPTVTGDANATTGTAGAIAATPAP